MADLYRIALLSFVGVLVYYVTAALSRRRRMQGAKEPPGLRGWPLIGNAPDLANSQGQLIPIFGQWAKEYGPIAQFSILGEKQVVVSSDQVAHDLFVKRGSKYSGRGTPYAAAYITRNLNPALMPKSDGWRRERKLIHNTVSISANNKYQSLIGDESTITLRDLIQTPAKFDQHFGRYSYAVLTHSLLGFTIKSVDDPWRAQNESLLDNVMQAFRPDVYPANTFSFLRHMPAWLIASNAKMKRIRDQADHGQQHLKTTVQASVLDGTAKDSVYKHFLENRHEHPVSDDEAGHAFLAMIGAGTRSPHNVLLTFLFLMMEYPEWQEKLQRQLDHVVGSDRLPTFADLPNLPIARAIVKEGIRYRSIKAELGIPHRLDEDDVYDGYFFSEGTVFHTNFAAILMDKDMFPDQLDFNPARWLEPSYPTYKEPLTVHPSCQNYTPFGYGRRACPGYDLAERTLTIMEARIAWACTIRKPLDPVTGQPVVIDMQYEPTPNPKPLPFPCDIRVRNEKIAALVSKEAEKVANSL